LSIAARCRLPLSLSEYLNDENHPQSYGYALNHENFDCESKEILWPVALRDGASGGPANYNLRLSRFMTVVAYHWPPRAVRMPRRFKVLAKPW
jgi:hypothetical protein